MQNGQSLLVALTSIRNWEDGIFSFLDKFSDLILSHKCEKGTVICLTVPFQLTCRVVHSRDLEEG